MATVLATVTLGEDGLIELPEDLCRHLGLAPGDRLGWTIAGDGVLIEKLADAHPDPSEEVPEAR